MWLGCGWEVHIDGALGHSSRRTSSLFANTQPQLILKAILCLLLPFEAQVAVCCFGSEAELGFHPVCYRVSLPPALQLWSLPEGALIVWEVDGAASREVSGRQRAYPGGSQTLLHVTVIYLFILLSETRRRSRERKLWAVMTLPKL